MPENSWKDWFVFSAKGKQAFTCLLLIIFVFLCFLMFYQPEKREPEVKYLTEAISSLSNDSAGNPVRFYATKKQSTADIHENQLFPFDPNRLDEEGWLRLGLREKTVRTILNYRSKGGRFRTPEDIRKIYGLKKEEADKLIPFIRIPDFPSASAKENARRFAATKPIVIDVNTASAEQWKSLPAIGDVLSARIVKYREKIGGFTSVEQVRNVYGLKDSSFQIILPYLRISSQIQTVSKAVSSQTVNINTATETELKNNPHLSPEIAAAIVIYRKQHGRYHEVSDIKKIVFINDEIFGTIAPYLSVE